MRTLLTFLLLPLSFISLSLQNLRKDGHQNNPSESKEENLMRPSSSRDDHNRRQGQDFLGRRLQLQGSPFNNFGESLIIYNKGTSKIPAELLQTSRNNKNTDDKSVDPQGIRAVKCEQLSWTKYFEENLKSGYFETLQIRCG